MNTIKHSITIKNKRHEYYLETKKDGVTRVRCVSASIDQDFLNEDIPALLQDLPNLIIAEQKYVKAKNTVVHIRMRTDEKEKLEQKAIKSGFNSISGYMRNLALN